MKRTRIIVKDIDVRLHEKRMELAAAIARVDGKPIKQARAIVSIESEMRIISAPS